MYFRLSAAFLLIFLASGFDAKRTTLEEDLTVLIDYKKYQINQKLSERVRRQTESTGNATRDTRQGSFLPIFIHPNGNITLAPDGNITLAPFYLNEEHESHPPQDADDDDGESETAVEPCTDAAKCGQASSIECADPVNEVYQKCGNKCVLGCRYATSSAGITIAKNDCDKNDCVEGCFCKTGLVRHQDKCIPPTECPIRKCYKNEVYRCGAAVPITCDNASRAKQILLLTKEVDCVWGCYCAQGYVKSNFNGKCILEKECRDNKAVEFAPQIPGEFKLLNFLSHTTPPPEIHIHNHNEASTGCGSSGCVEDNRFQHHEGGFPHHHVGHHDAGGETDVMVTLNNLNNHNNNNNNDNNNNNNNDNANGNSNANENVNVNDLQNYIHNFLHNHLENYITLCNAYYRDGGGWNGGNNWNPSGCPPPSFFNRTFGDDVRQKDEIPVLNNLITSTSDTSSFENMDIAAQAIGSIDKPVNAVVTITEQPIAVEDDSAETNVQREENNSEPEATNKQRGDSSQPSSSNLYTKSNANQVSYNGQQSQPVYNNQFTFNKLNQWPPNQPYSPYPFYPALPNNVNQPNYINGPVLQYPPNYPHPQYMQIPAVQFALTQAHQNQVAGHGPQHIPPNTFQHAPQNIPQHVFQDIPQNIPQHIPQNTFHLVSQNMPQPVLQQAPPHVPQNFVQQAPQNIVQHMPLNIPQHVPQTPQHTLQNIPQTIPHYVPQMIPQSFAHNTPLTQPQPPGVSNPPQIMSQNIQFGFIPQYPNQPYNPYANVRHPQYVQGNQFIGNP